MPFLSPALFIAKSQTLATALRFGGVNQRLQRTLGTGAEFNSANRSKATHSFWFRVPTLGIFNPIFTSDNGAGGSYIAINSSNKLQIRESDGADLAYRNEQSSMTISADTWHHGFVSIDSARVGTSQVVRIYIDGVLGLAGGVSTIGSSLGLQSLTHSIGFHANTSTYFDGDLAIMHWVDDVAMEPTDFADTIDGIYQAKAVAPTYGINGHFLPFADPDNLGADFDNGWTYTLSNITAADLIGDGPPTSY